MASVVLVGRFNPSDFLPQKLADAGVLGKDEAAAALLQALIPSQVVEYTLPWGKIQAFADRLIFEANHIPYVRIADLATKALREVASNYFVNQLGINWSAHYRVANVKTRDEIGTRLAPPHAWGTWGEAILQSFDAPASEGVHGGMVSLVMRRIKPDNREAGWIDARVEPSSKILAGEGVFFLINDHYQLKPESYKIDVTVGNSALLKPTENLLETLEQNFDISIERSENIIREVLK